MVRLRRRANKDDEHTTKGTGGGRRRTRQPLEHRLLMTATFCLLAGGAVMVFSASSARTLLTDSGDGTQYLIKYAAYGALGVVAMQILARRGLETVRTLTPAFVGVSLVLMLLVLVPGLGVEINGARRWLGIGPVQFQPSEVMKLALVLHAANVIGQRPHITRRLQYVIGPVLLPAAGALLLIAMTQRDLGTALVIAMTFASILFAAGVPLRQIGLLAAVGAFLVVVLALIEPYRRARLTSFLDPWDAGASGFQAVQGQIAIGSGGLLGLGPGQSMQKMLFLPEAHTDFILAVIGEELGFVGICVLLLLYGMIGYAGLRTARAARGVYAKILAAGLTSLILCQALLNVYAVLGLAPLTGVPLPFISSGSTSLCMLLCAMGLLLNIAAGGSAHLREVKPRPGRSRARDGATAKGRPAQHAPDSERRAAGDGRRAEEDRDRRRRDRGTRRPGPGRRRRAAG